MAPDSTAFSDSQYDAFCPPGIEHHYWNGARNPLIAQLLRRHGLASTALLEVGCGKGIVLQYLHDAGFNCRGVELADVRPRAAIEHLVTTGTAAERLPQGERDSYEALLLLDVVEHIEDPASFLMTLVARFPNVRKVVITVPARAELWSDYDEYFGHFRRYNLEMIRALARDAGRLRVDEARYFFRCLYPPARLVSWLKASRTTTPSAPSGAARTAHRLIASVLKADWHVLPGAVPGSSIAAVLSVP